MAKERTSSSALVSANGICFAHDLFDSYATRDLHPGFQQLGNEKVARGPKYACELAHSLSRACSGRMA
jgi:hypothetical protein